MFKISACIFLLNIIILNFSYGKNIENLVVNGNKRISTNTIKVKNNLPEEDPFFLNMISKSVKNIDRVILDFDKIKEALNFGGPYKLALEEISKKEIQIPKVLLDNSEGVVTMNYLKTNFPTVAHASLKASLKQTDESGLGGKLLGFLKSQVTVRSLDAQEGNSINAILSRMQVALNNDDLSEVIRQSSDLNGAAKSEIKDWLSLAVKRQETVDAFSEMLGN